MDLRTLFPSNSVRNEAHFCLFLTTLFYTENDLLNHYHNWFARQTAELVSLIAHRHCIRFISNSCRTYSIYDCCWWMLIESMKLWILDSIAKHRLASRCGSVYFLSWVSVSLPVVVTQPDKKSANRTALCVRVARQLQRI